MHPELGIHVRGSFGSGRVGVMVAHGAMALYDQDTADEVDRMCAHKMEPLVPAQPLPFNPVAHWVDPDEIGRTRAYAPPVVFDQPDEDTVKRLLSGHSGPKNEGVKGPDSPLVGPKIRHNPRKKKGGIADL